MDDNNLEARQINIQIAQSQARTDLKNETRRRSTQTSSGSTAEEDMQDLLNSIENSYEMSWLSLVYKDPDIEKEYQ